MAKVILEPIGRPRDQFLPEEIWSRQLGQMSELNGELQSKRTEVRDGWGESYRRRVHAKGKMTSWERVEQLKDAVTANPETEVTVDLEQQQMMCGDITADVSMPQSARQALVSGEWDFLGQLLANGDAVRETASELPYMRQFV